jgi:hypothetical protein
MDPCLKLPGEEMDVTAYAHPAIKRSSQSYIIGMVTQGSGRSRRRCRAALTLLEWRRELGLSQADFARKAFGLRQATYALWETSMDNDWLQRRLQCSRESRTPGAPGAHPYYYEQLAQMLRSESQDKGRFETYRVAHALGFQHDFDIESPDDLEEQALEWENSVAGDESIYPAMPDQVGFAIISPGGLDAAFTGNLRSAERTRSLGQLVLWGVPLERNKVIITVMADDRLASPPHLLARGSLVAVDTQDVELVEGAVYLCRFGQQLEFGIAAMEGAKRYLISSHWDQRRYPPRRLGGPRANVVGRIKTITEVMAHMLDVTTEH